MYTAVLEAVGKLSWLSVVLEGMCTLLYAIFDNIA